MPKFNAIGVLTGGGDCPGLNAVIRAVTRSAIKNGLKVYGIENGFGGLVDGKIKLLTEREVSGILPRGGTILGTTNRDNPFKYAVRENNEVIFVDKSQQALDNLQKYGIDVLVVIGGDGSLRIASEFAALGVQVVAVPKTIDNDLPGTERTFGFDTAVMVATEALDRLHTTAESHHRVMILEVMGRYAGWIALYAGMAGGADCIIIPEIPYTTEAIINKIKNRQQAGKNFSIIVVAEGAKEKGKDIVISRIVEDSAEKVRLGGIGNVLAAQIEKLTDVETRCTILGHLQRGGSPTAFDRVLATRYGVGAVEAILDGHTGCMVALKNNQIIRVPITAIAGKMRNVPVDGEIVRFAKQIGICFGD